MEQAKQILLPKIKDAWIISNYKQNEIPFFEPLIENDIFSITPYGPTNNGSLVYRIIYALALNQNTKSLDPSDFVDPTDCTYSIAIPSVVDSSNYTHFLNVIVDRVDGVSFN
jgi:hypothetical protein